MFSVLYYVREEKGGGEVETENEVDGFGWWEYAKKRRWGKKKQTK